MPRFAGPFVRVLTNSCLSLLLHAARSAERFIEESE